MTDSVLDALKQIASGTYTPEDVRRLAALPASETDTLEARVDSPDGFFAFCRRIDGGVELPEHNRQEVLEAFRAHEEGKGFSLLGWRGSYKSVTLAAKFMAWRIGINPLGTSIVISANDDTAEKVTKLTALIVEQHPAWKEMFPTIVPVTGNWSVEGYWVWDNSYSQEEWAAKRASTIDPTFVGGGFTSTRINGKHPTELLIMDDIQSTYLSKKEQSDLRHTVSAVILKMPVTVNDKWKTWVHHIGVPWPGEDVHTMLKKSGSFRTMEIPAMTRAKDGEGVYIDGLNEATGKTFDDIRGWWKLTSEDRFGVKSIMRERALGKFEFYQMIMLDLTSGQEGGLRYYTFPHANVDETWPVHGGGDPAFTLKEKGENITKNSAFALGYLAKKPSGGAVLIGGVLEKCTLQQSAGFIAAAQSIFQNWVAAFVENSGMGMLFIQAIRLINPGLKIITSDLGGIRMTGEKAGRAKSKHDRILIELAPWLENAVVLISDKPDDKYLQAVRDGLDNFATLDPETADERLDALDGFYHAVKSMPEVLQQMPSETIKSVRPRVRMKSPLAGMGAQRGYG